MGTKASWQKNESAFLDMYNWILGCTLLNVLLSLSSWQPPSASIWNQWRSSPTKVLPEFVTTIHTYRFRTNVIRTIVFEVVYSISSWRALQVTPTTLPSFPISRIWRLAFGPVNNGISQLIMMHSYCIDRYVTFGMTRPFQIRYNRMDRFFDH